MVTRILDSALAELRDAGFTAETAYPGQLYHPIKSTTVALHVHHMDDDTQTLTLEANVCCPASMGAVRAEVQAYRVADALRQAGAKCLQQSFRYDGAARAYIVPVKAVFSEASPNEALLPDVEFQVYLNGDALPYAVAFRAKYDTGNDVSFRNGEDAALEKNRIVGYWIVTIEELIPNGIKEVPSNHGQFDLVVNRRTVSEAYRDCVWTDLRREHTKDGLLRIREGIAQLREEGVTIE